MYSWEEWHDYYVGTTKPPPIIMSSLRPLSISYCPLLKAPPDYILKNTMLHSLYISQSCLLRECYEKGEDWSKFSHISEIRILWELSNRTVIREAVRSQAKAWHEVQLLGCWPLTRGCNPRISKAVINVLLVQANLTLEF